MKLKVILEIEDLFVKENSTPEEALMDQLTEYGEYSTPVTIIEIEEIPT
jgi:hypothetical protein